MSKRSYLVTFNLMLIIMRNGIVIKTFTKVLYSNAISIAFPYPTSPQILHYNDEMLTCKYRNLGKPENLGSRFMVLLCNVIASRPWRLSRLSSGRERSSGSTMKSSSRESFSPSSQLEETLSRRLFRSISRSTLKLAKTLPGKLGKLLFSRISSSIGCSTTRLTVLRPSRTLGSSL